VTPGGIFAATWRSYSHALAATPSEEATAEPTSPRDPLTGPTLHTTGLSISKTFGMPYAESHQILFRTEFFNSFNSPQFDLPGGTLGTGTFGVVTGTGP
jgi:hypothetical protein